MSLKQWALYVVIKRLFFATIFAVFLRQSIVEILLLPLFENKRPPYSNFTSGVYFELFIGMWFSTNLPFFELDDQQQSYDIMKIFQDSGRKAAIPSQIYFRLTVLWRLAFRKVKTICLSNSIRYLNPRRRYYYFRFLKTNVRHIEILPPVSILTFSL